MKTQATRANRAQVERHIANQYRYGERMIGKLDAPRPIELIVTAAVLIAGAEQLHSNYPLLMGFPA